MRILESILNYLFSSNIEKSKLLVENTIADKETLSNTKKKKGEATVFMNKRSSLAFIFA